MGFSLNPPKVKLFAEGSAATKQATFGANQMSHFLRVRGFGSLVELCYRNPIQNHKLDLRHLFICLKNRSSSSKEMGPKHLGAFPHPPTSTLLHFAKGCEDFHLCFWQQTWVFRLKPQSFSRTSQKATKFRFLVAALKSLKMVVPNRVPFFFLGPK